MVKILETQPDAYVQIPLLTRHEAQAECLNIYICIYIYQDVIIPRTYFSGGYAWVIVCSIIGGNLDIFW